MQDELPPEIEQRIKDATERFGQALREPVRWSYQEDQAPSAAQIEERIREWIRRIGEDTQSWVMGNMDQYRPKGKQPCPRCGTPVYWHRYEPRRYLTSLGSLRLERAYYYHGACHCGWVPMDERLGLGACEMSPFVQEMASYLGAFMPFEQVVNYLQRYQEIEISHDTANEVTTRIGQVLREEQEASVSLAWDEGQIPESQVDEPPQEIYVSADGINHSLPNGQGKEIKVAAVYETEKRAQRGAEGGEAIRAVNIEYFVAEDAETLARTAYVAAAKRGATRAEKRIVLGDGAHWIWNRVASTMRVPDCVEVLDFHHASVRLASSGKECLELLSRETPSFMLVDIQMPEMTGYELLHRIRANTQWRDIPVIAVTAHAMSGDEERIIRAGFNGYIPKPVNVTSLIDDLRQILNAGEPA